MRRFALIVGIALATGCSSQEDPTATIVLTAGQELDAFTREPVPVRLELDAVSLTGASEPILEIAWPARGFDIGDYDPDRIVAFEAFGRDASGQTVVRGASVFHLLWTLDGAEVPLFMGRVGELSRPAGQLPVTRSGGTAAIVDARFVVSAGGSEVRDADGAQLEPATFGAYDLGAWNASPARAALPRSPASLAVVMGRYALVVDDAGASWFDFASYAVGDAEPPEGFTFGEVSGGRVISGTDGEIFVVGPTRTDAPSAAVLRIDGDGQLSAVRLSVPRQGAAAAYVPGRGLLLAGGHETEPGVVLLGPGATSFVALPYAADPVRGAGAALLDESRVVLAGGSDAGAPAATRVVDPACSAECAATVLGDPPLAAGIPHAWARSTGPDEVLVVGEGDGDAGTRVLRLVGLDTTPRFEEVVWREPRAGATPVAIFGRSVAMVGGVRPDGSGVRSIEVYVPR